MALFKPGNPGGPGRRKGIRSATDIVSEMLSEPSQLRPGLTREQSIWQVACDKAEEGDRHFWNALVDRGYGPVVKRVEMTDIHAAAAARREALAATENGGEESSPPE